MLLDDSTGATIEITCGRPVPTTQKVNTTTATAASVTLEHPSVVPDAHFLGVTATGREIDLRAVDIGTVVKAKGGIGSWRGEKQMLLERICMFSISMADA